jgi:hypothetical protein
MAFNDKNNFLSIKATKLTAPRPQLNTVDLFKLLSLKDSKSYKKELLDLAFKTSLETSCGSLSFDSELLTNGVEGHYLIYKEFTFQYAYSERGSTSIIAKCNNLIELTYYFFKHYIMKHTSSTAEIFKTLDRIDDHRLLIWLRMSAEIYNMFQINKSYGEKTLKCNIIWMCEELVRMKLFTCPSKALRNKQYIIHGLKLSGMPESFAQQIYTKAL